MVARMLRLGLTLMLVGMVAAAGLGLTYGLTKDKIAEQQELQEIEAAIEALPAVQFPDDLEEDPELFGEVKGRVEGLDKVFTSSYGYIMIVRARGYGGPIVMAVGIDMEGRVQGISVITHTETPGLGSQMEEPEFLDQFKGKTVDDPLEVGVDIDSITGATVTAKAVAKDVREALEAHELLMR